MLKKYKDIKSYLHLPLIGLYGKAIILFFFSRLIFVLANGSAFTKIVYNHLFEAFIFGLRLDFITTFYCISALYIIFILSKSKLISTIVISFFTFAVVFLALIDALYFTFLKEHISFDFFTQLNPDNNISVWTYITDFWYMALIGLAMTALFVVWARRSFNKSSPVKWLSLIPILAVGFLVARGGFRLKPLRTADTGQYLYSSAHVVAYNAPLYLFETWRNPISTPDFISDYTKPIDPTSFQSDSLRKPNFVILILEGFGKEYTGLNRGMTHTYTPFLNSLIPKSVCCHNAYANGLKSIDAVPAIFTGLPKLSNTAIIHSPHSSQPVPSIFNLLKEIGYTSSFFHGAHNQTMG
ncbi:MAG: glucan phosphoethanolaminetransferase (alkaline phosphatase superfamily), partial [Bacteroidia bacterium]